MIEIGKQDESKVIRNKLLENARELIETNFSEYIPVLKERQELITKDEFGFNWEIKKLRARSYKVRVYGDIWCSTMDTEFEIIDMVLPKVRFIQLNTKRKTT